MQHFANVHRPLTALILLAACSGGGSSTLLTGRADSVNSSNSAIEGDVGAGGALEGTATEADAGVVGASDAQPAQPARDSGRVGTDAGASEPPSSDGGSARPPLADGGTTLPEPGCGNAVVDPGEQCDLGTANGGNACAEDCTVPPPPLGACLSCAQNTCPVQFANALGVDSNEENFAVVGQLLGCVVGADWQAGGAIPSDSCFFSDPTQPAGSMVPCYCGSTPTSQCLATGPVDSAQACGREIELASGCSPATASCVTISGSSPAVALGDVLQLFNCERVACTIECGFPPPVEE
jgi:hypothetical protein